MPWDMNGQSCLLMELLWRRTKRHTPRSCTHDECKRFRTQWKLNSVGMPIKTIINNKYKPNIPFMNIKKYSLYYKVHKIIYQTAFTQGSDYLNSPEFLWEKFTRNNSFCHNIFKILMTIYCFTMELKNNGISPQSHKPLHNEPAFQIGS